MDQKRLSEIFGTVRLKPKTMDFPGFGGGQSSRSGVGGSWGDPNEGITIQDGMLKQEDVPYTQSEEGGQVPQNLRDRLRAGFVGAGNKVIQSANEGSQAFSDALNPDLPASDRATGAMLGAEKVFATGAYALGGALSPLGEVPGIKQGMEWVGKQVEPAKTEEALNYAADQLEKVFGKFDPKQRAAIISMLPDFLDAVTFKSVEDVAGSIPVKKITGAAGDLAAKGLEKGKEFASATMPKVVEGVQALRDVKAKVGELNADQKMGDLFAQKEKLAAEILQPPAAKGTTAIVRGQDLPAIRAFAEILKEPFKTFQEGRDIAARERAILPEKINASLEPVKHVRLATDDIHGPLNEAIRKAKASEHGKIEAAALEKVLQKDIADMSANGGDFPIGKMKVDKFGDPIEDMTTAQGRKQAWNQKVKNAHERSKGGSETAFDQATTKGYELLREGYQKAIERYAPDVEGFNPRYGGLTDAIKMLSAQAARSQKAIPPTIWEKIAKVTGVVTGNLSKQVMSAADLAAGIEKSLKSKTKTLVKTAEKTTNKYDKGGAEKTRAEVQATSEKALADITREKNRIAAEKAKAQYERNAKQAGKDAATLPKEKRLPGANENTQYSQSGAVKDVKPINLGDTPEMKVEKRESYRNNAKRAGENMARIPGREALPAPKEGKVYDPSGRVKDVKPIELGERNYRGNYEPYPADRASAWKAPEKTEMGKEYNALRAELYGKAEAEVYAELAEAKAGKRVPVKDGEGYRIDTMGVKSTFPKWIKDGYLRDSDLIKTVLEKRNSGKEIKGNAKLLNDYINAEIKNRVSKMEDYDYLKSMEDYLKDL